MTIFSLLFMMQVVISTKGGFVNDVQGMANVKTGQVLDSGTSIMTGAEGRVEVLLNPGSYLRLTGNSEAVLEGLDFPDVGVRIIRGDALIEAAGFDKRTPLEVSANSFKANIIDDGIYLISDSAISVIDGKLQPLAAKTTYGKGWQVSSGSSVKLGKRVPTALESWSLLRSEELAKANVDVGLSLRESPNVKVDDLFDVWLWSPRYGTFTFMPGYGYRSPYGHTYLAVRNIFVVGGVFIGPNPRPAPGGGTADITPAATATVTTGTSSAAQPLPTPAPPPARR
jgi:hypothetical protein